MRVRVVGPNLNDQTRGTFHVHADGCADLTKYGPGRRFGGDCPGERETPLDVETRVEVVSAIYSDQLHESGSEPTDSIYFNDFHYAPCCKGLPTGLPKGGAGTTPTLHIEVRPKETSGEELADWDLALLAKDIDPDGIYDITTRVEEGAA